MLGIGLAPSPPPALRPARRAPTCGVRAASRAGEAGTGFLYRPHIDPRAGLLGAKMRRRGDRQGFETGLFILCFARDWRRPPALFPKLGAGLVLFRRQLRRDDWKRPGVDCPPAPPASGEGHCWRVTLRPASKDGEGHIAKVLLLLRRAGQELRDGAEGGPSAEAYGDDEIVMTGGGDGMGGCAVEFQKLLH